MAKVLSHSSTNPKLSMKVSTPVKGYAAGGEVVDTRPVTQKSRTVYVDEKGKAGPAGTAYSAPVTIKERFGRGGQRDVTVTTPREESWSEYGEGLVYTPYDTTMEAQAKAPTVGFGEAAKVSAMPEIAKPGEVKYYGESKKEEAQKFSDERFAAYNRRMENAAIRTGNVLPGQEAPKAVYSMAPSQTPKSVQVALPKLSPKAEMPKMTPAKLTPDSLVNTTAMLSPQSKVLYKASDFIDYVKQRKKKGEV
jgi:hypothetical protein